MTLPAFPTTLLLLSLCATLVAAQNATSTPLSQALPQNSLLQQPSAQAMVDELLVEIAEKGGCDTNVCFTIDGTSLVAAEEFRQQLEFVQIIGAIVGADERSHFAAAQATRPLRPISALTEDSDEFLLNVARTTQRGGLRNGLRNAIRFCSRELDGVDDVNKMVVLADGRSIFPRGSVEEAEAFREIRDGNAVCAVGVGFTDNSRFLRALAGDQNRVLRIDGYFELLDIIDQLVAEICDL